MPNQRPPTRDEHINWCIENAVDRLPTPDHNQHQKKLAAAVDNFLRELRMGPFIKDVPSSQEFRTDLKRQLEEALTTSEPFEAAEQVLRSAVTAIVNDDPPVNDGTTKG